MGHLWVLLFDVFVLGGICFMGAIVFLWRYRTQRSGRRSPLTRRLLRSPGESLRALMEIPVQPVVALPGWFVRRSNSHHIPVLAVGEIQGYFSSRPKQPEMTAQLVRQIVHQLDQKCRDVAPRAYGQGSPASDMAPAR